MEKQRKDTLELEMETGIIRSRMACPRSGSTFFSRKSYYKDNKLWESILGSSGLRVEGGLAKPGDIETKRSVDVIQRTPSKTRN